MPKFSNLFLKGLTRKCAVASWLVSTALLSGCQTAPFRWGNMKTERASDGASSKSPVLRNDRNGISWPVPSFAKLTREFNQSFDKHDGIDLAAASGTPIYAAHDGVVVYAGSEFSGYGKFVIIENSTPWSSFYAHLKSFAVKEGAQLKRGDLVGYMGATGNARGVHLHFELRYAGRPVDPLEYLP